MLVQKRFVKKLLLSLLPLGVAAGALLSCSNLSSGTGGGMDNTAESAKFTGKGARVYVSLPGQGRSARSAVPSAFEDANGDLIFAGAIYKSGANPVPPLQLAEYTPASGGTPASLVVPFDISSSARTGCYFELYAFPSQYDYSGGFDHTQALLSVQILNIEIPANAESLDLGTVFMQPHSATAQGSVSLAVTLPNDCDISFSESAFSYDSSSGKITAAIDAGTYTVDFIVTKGGQTAYSWTEIIYVYPGMVTNAWNTGEGGTTQRVIDAAQMYNTFYVRGSGGTWIAGITSAAGDDTNGNGSLAKPYATVQAAVDKILAINDGSTEYMIYVDGTVTAASGKAVVDLSDSLTKDLNLTINSLTVNVSQKTAILTGNGNRVIYAKPSSGKLTFTLNNLKITGGNTTSISAKAGGGVRVDGNVEFNINNCLISNNTAGDSGGGIYIIQSATDAKMKITDSEISDNNAGTGVNSNGGGLSVNSNHKGDAYITRTKILRNKAANGGGIALSGAYLYIENCTEFSGNTTNENEKPSKGIYAFNGIVILTGATSISDALYFAKAPIQISSDFSLNGVMPIPVVPEMDSSITDCFTPDDKAIIKGIDGVNELSETDTDKLSAFKIVDTNYTIEYSASKKGGIIKAVAPLQAMSLADAISALENATSADNPLEITVKIEASNQSDAFDALESLADAVYSTSASSVDLVITQITGTTAFGAADDTLYFGNKIKSLKIPEGIEEIYNLWFVKNGTSKLESVELPSTLKIIGEEAFKNCYELTSIVIPNGVTVIGNSAFDSCETLASVTLPNTLEEIGDYAFDGCDFTSIIIPVSVTKIGYETFGSCSNLNSVEFTNTSGWKATDNSSYNGGSTIIVTDTGANANKLKSTMTTDSWCHKYLYRED